MKSMKRVILMATMTAVMLCTSSELKAQDERLNSFTKENIIKVCLGPSIMTSKIIMPVYSYLGGDGVAGSLRMKRLIGIDVAATYQHLWRKGFGIGLDYVLGHTFMAQSYGQIDQHYIGPSFVYSYRGWERFSTNVAVGLGYVRCRSVYNPAVQLGPGAEAMRARSIDITEKENALGLLIRAGFEYRVDAHWGAGAELNLMSSQFEVYKDIEEKDTANDGIARLNLLIGVSYHF